VERGKRKGKTWKRYAFSSQTKKKGKKKENVILISSFALRGRKIKMMPNKRAPFFIPRPHEQLCQKWTLEPLYAV
jgi:hypothetical protein